MVADLNISQLLDSSKLISKEDKNQLSQLKDEFPWSEIIQVLYLKSLKDTHDIRFSAELKRVALISHDRTKLYYFLYGSEIQETIDKVESEMAALPDEEGLISPDWHKNISPTSETKSDEIISADVPEMKLTPEIGLSPIAELEQVKEREEAKELEVKQNLIENKLENETPIHEALIEEVIEKIETESLSPLELEKTEEVIEEVAIVDRTEELIEEALEENEAAELKKEVSASEKELNHLIISEAIDSVIVKDVIDDMHDKRSKETAPVKEAIAPAAAESLSSDEFIAWLVNNAKAVNYPSFGEGSGVYSVPNVESIIDKFIQAEPQIRKGKAKEYEKGNLAASSLVDKEEFVTETLAEIYVSQGNNSKAKRAFQLLSLKYPEKSIYFAARIKQLGRKK